jgi:hypothetical protein
VDLEPQVKIKPDPPVVANKYILQKRDRVHSVKALLSKKRAAMYSIPQKNFIIKRDRVQIPGRVWGRSSPNPEPKTIKHKRFVYHNTIAFSYVVLSLNVNYYY